MLRQYDKMKTDIKKPICVNMSI